MILLDCESPIKVLAYGQQQGACCLGAHVLVLGFLPVPQVGQRRLAVAVLKLVGGLVKGDVHEGDGLVGVLVDEAGANEEHHAAAGVVAGADLVDAVVRLG